MATKTKTTKKKTTTSPELPGVNLDDLAILAGQNAVAYGPQINQIRDLTRQTDEQYQSDIEAAKSNAKSAQLYANRAIPTVKDIYGGAESENTKAHKLVTDVVGAQPNDPFSRAIAAEAEGQRNRTTTGRTGTLTELQNRIVGAESGKQLALTQARKEQAKTKGILSQKLSDILQEQGATSAATLTTLRQNRDAADAKSQSEADKLSAKDQAAKDKRDAAAAKEKKKHQTEVRTATGDFATRIENAIGTWKQYASEVQPVTKINSEGKEIVDVDDKGKPKTRPATPSEVKSAMLDAGYTPGEIHIALLRRVRKPLDAEALTYLKGLKAKGVRIPREWLRVPVVAVPGLGDATGPPIS